MSIEKINEQAIREPLSKSELKKQFVEQTEKLGLKHTFTFDEAWELAQELRKREEYRERMTSLSKEMIDMGAMTGKEVDKVNPLKHNFVGGCYIREVYNPANMLIITKIHKKEHPFFLMEGSMSILTENGIETISAPHNGITKPGTQRVIFTHEPCRFITVHATTAKTVEEVEEEVIAKDFKDEDIALNASDYSELLGLNINNKKEL